MKSNTIDLASQQSETIAGTFMALRESSVSLCSTLTPEDCNLQAMPETSPAKWHLAHTTWFFETFVLGEYSSDYVPLNPLYEVLFNSYYNGIGEQFPRAERSLLSRPTLAEVFEYREMVNASIIGLLSQVDHPKIDLIHQRIELGLHHEAQHQELILTDIKYNLFQSPLFPAYRQQVDATIPSSKIAPLKFILCEGGKLETGHYKNAFCFDNEQPRHIEYLAPFKFADRLVTSGEYREFVADGGYENPDYWLADGWHEVQQGNWKFPLYWGYLDGQWLEYTLDGLQTLDESMPVSHLSYFEAQAYAAWAGKRLPTEAEWESVAQLQNVAGNLADTGRLQPQPCRNASDKIDQLYGDCWEWTQSAYLPYPGYKPLSGTVGEYNGKFMNGQMVLRGGSCLSQAFHIRSSYRNFFYPRDRWQCSGIRLAADI